MGIITKFLSGYIKVSETDTKTKNLKRIPHAGIVYAIPLIFSLFSITRTDMQSIFQAKTLKFTIIYLSEI